jgi:hypothetical protein
MGITSTGATADWAAKEDRMAEATPKHVIEPKKLVEMVLAERDQNGHREDEIVGGYTGYDYAETLLEELRAAHFKRPARK